MLNLKASLVSSLTLCCGAALAQPPAVTPELLAKGKSSFTMFCAPCHGEKGVGDGPGAAALNPKPRNFAKEAFKQGETPEQIFKTLSTGIPNTAMVAFAHVPEADRWALAFHVLSLKYPGKDLTKSSVVATKAEKKSAAKK